MASASASSVAASIDCSSVEVALRVRPMAASEKMDGCEKALIALDGTSIMVGADKTFTYNYAYGSDSSQESVRVPLRLRSCRKGSTHLDSTVMQQL